MKTSCRTSRARTALGCAALCALAACAHPQDPTPAEWRPLESARPPREPLPDDAERIAGRLAAAVLDGRREDAEAQAAALAREDALREERGELPSGLADNAAELFAATGGSLAYPDRTDALLDRDDLDPALRRRVELARDAEPLHVADARLGEERRARIGALFNRVIEPLSTLALTGVLNPLAASRSALSALLAVNQLPTGTPRERQALHALDEWRATHPEHPESAEVAARAEGLRERLVRERYERWIRGARDASERGDWQAAEILAERAERQRPEGSEAIKLRQQAEARLAEREARAQRSLEVRALAPESQTPEQRERFAALARAAAIAPYGEVAARAREYAAAGAPAEQASTLRLLASFEPLARSDQDEFAEALRRVPEPWGSPDTAARQAGAMLADRSANAWDAYQAAQSADRRAVAAWIALGRFTNGATERNLPRPLEYLLDAPGFAVAIATFPLRVIQYPGSRAQFGGAVLVAGERYVARYPDGAHAEEVRAELEHGYALRGQWAAALEHAEKRREPDAADVAEYRAKVAEQLLAAADKQQRVDLRLAYLATVLRDYGDTPSAAAARTKFVAERAAASPQRIRLTREFLLEHPALWAPGALALKPELLDGKGANGEMAEQGVTLLGRNAIEIALVGRDPVVARVPAADFTRFVAQLEETRYASLATDERERATPDAARDAFFAAARLGVAENAEPRPAARSDAVFESTHEKHGFVRTRESILPVDLVLRGDLTTLGLAAFPRIRMPDATPDAMLYQ